MQKLKCFLLGVLIPVGVAFCSTITHAHEMTPTYPKLIRSFQPGVYTTTLNMINRRNDVEYYEISVMDKDFNDIPFVSSYSIVKIQYMERLTIDIYIAERDYSKSMYVCSQSKLKKSQETKSIISSRICSKFEHARTE